MDPCRTRFTAAEGGARLAAAAGTRNLLVTEHAAFITTSVLVEHAHQIRGALSAGRRRSAVVSRASRVACTAHELRVLTDLDVCEARACDEVPDWDEELECKEVLVCTSEVLRHILQEKTLTIPDLNVLIIDSCHLIFEDENLQFIMNLYKQYVEPNRPRILALTYPLFAAPKEPDEDDDEDSSEKDDSIKDHVDIDKEKEKHKSGTAKDEPKGDIEKGHKQKDGTDDDGKDKDELIGSTEKDLEQRDGTSNDEHEELKNEATETDDKEKNDEQKGGKDGKDKGSDSLAIGAYENLDDFEMYEKLEWKLEQLEEALCCEVDLAEDVDGGKSSSGRAASRGGAGAPARPRELLAEHRPPARRDRRDSRDRLERYMRDVVRDAVDFLDEHRYDPTEIYGEDLYEEFMNIPDPTIDPKRIFNEFLYVLDELGPYAADKAAFSLLSKLEKLKIKVPYERHFLLLCLCTSVFVKIRCYADLVFSKYTSDWEKITAFSTPKVLRLAEILEQFQPEGEKGGRIEDSIKNVQDGSNENVRDDSNQNVQDASNDNVRDVSNKIVQDDSNENVQDVSNKNDQDDSNRNDQVSANKSIQDSNTDSNLDTKSDECDDTVKNNSDENNKNSSSDSVTKDINVSKSNEEIVDDSNNESKEGKLKKSKTTELLTEIDSCDFVTLSNKIEDRVNTYQANLKDLDFNVSDVKSDKSIVDSDCRKSVSEKLDKLDKMSVRDGGETVRLGFKRTGHRSRGRGRAPRPVSCKAQQSQQNPDALCGIIYMKEPLMAKIMFMMIVDMSRSRAPLARLSAQYCAADGGEGAREGKKQEEVLKRFRMHECNLLLATSALEEGIDLPRCNLVVRWDLPPSYRSHGLCRSRARAPRSSVALLASEDTSAALVHRLAVYRELDQIITRKCGCGVQNEPPQEEENHADAVASLIKPYMPVERVDGEDARIDLDKDGDAADKTTDEIRDGKEVDLEDHNEEDKPYMPVERLGVSTDAEDARIDIDRVAADKDRETTDLKGDRREVDLEDHVEEDGSMRAQDTTLDDDSTDKLKELRIDVNMDKDGFDTKIYDMTKVDYRNSEFFNENSLMICNNDAMEQIKTDVHSEEEKVDVVNDTGGTDERKIIRDIHINVNNEMTKDFSDNNSYVCVSDRKESVCEISNELSKINLNQVKDKDKIVTIDTQFNNDDVGNSEKCDLEVNAARNIENKDLKEKESLDISLKDKCDGHKKIDISESVLDSEVCDKLNLKFEYKVKTDKKTEELASVDLNSAIALINRYCGKLPSDTFTRLAPQTRTERVSLADRGGRPRTAYVCTLRMPLNCPVKFNIVGHPMPTVSLARRVAALQACRALHRAGELDDQLLPVGKENFKGATSEAEAGAEAGAEAEVEAGGEADCARPGTTKRRQYYYKRTAWAFTDCQAIVDCTDEDIEKNPTPGYDDPCKANSPNAVYAAVSALWCALPERYNTRGRRLHAPQSAAQAVGLLMARRDPLRLQIPSFPVYTRSGEVRVSVEPAPRADARLSPARARLVRRFMRFVFSDVLRVRRRGMRLAPDACARNNYYVVPTIKKTNPNGETWIDIDWAFLELIYKHTEEKKSLELEKPMVWQEGEGVDEEKGAEGEGAKDEGEKGVVKKMQNPLLKPGEVFVFDAEKYKEAVVTPWYRNQDQPQFFLVAEICWNLTPDSAFPSAQHSSFRSYYRAKYGAELTQSAQPLLDVDHTSARLNLLTPRYVNRKGVALPVSSERTRRAKRDRLDQKQILVPELCRVHPFAAPLWFATVALPCVLYRVNALLVADEIRRGVSLDVGLAVEPRARWPPLDFGWSLAEVLSADSEKNDKRRDDEDCKKEEIEIEIKETEATTDSSKDSEEKVDEKEKTINDILQEKEDAESGFEIGTWSNDMASSLPPGPCDELSASLPPNVTLCTSSSGGANWSEPVDKPRSQFNPSRTFSMADSDCSYMSSDFDTSDSDVTAGSDDDTDTSGFCSSRNANAAMGVRIEYKTAHEAEAVDVARRKPVAPAPRPKAACDARDRARAAALMRQGRAPDQYVENFRRAVEKHKKEIYENHLISKEKPIVDLLPEPTRDNTLQDKYTLNLSMAKKNIYVTKCLEKSKETNYSNSINSQIENNKDSIKCINDDIISNVENCNDINNSEITNDFDDCCKSDVKMEESQVKETKLSADKKTIDKMNLIDEIFPYGDGVPVQNGQITLEDMEKNKRVLLAELRKSLSEEEIQKMHCFSMKDVDIDSPDYVNEKVANIGFDSKEKYAERVNAWEGERSVREFKPYYMDSKGLNGMEFDFDYQPDLEGHPGPSPSVILQALTMSNANDGINLERLETIGDSFLKFAITAHLYCAHPAVHEGKLSHMRSKQVSNLNLYRLGRSKALGARMIACKFEPHDNWLPPCHRAPHTLQPAGAPSASESPHTDVPVDSSGCFIPYNLITQHSIPDKSIADCVEALIGAYLLECGPRGALLFMSWLGIRVLPKHVLPLSDDHPYVKRARSKEEGSEKKETTKRPRTRPSKPSSSDSSSSDSWSETEDEPDMEPPEEDWSWPGRPVGALRPYRDEQGRWMQPIFGELRAPPSPLLRYISDPEGELEQMLSGYDALERTLQYRFRDRSLLLQALTHASHQRNRLTDCYQRLEFLGDAVLDYLITRQLYEEPRRHSPGALTDLRSALVNNTIFATLAARHGLHKYFRHTSPGLHEVLSKYVRIQEENGHSISEEHYLIQEDELEQAEDVEVPKALGDLFESVAGAIFLDSGLSLGAVWRSFGRLMRAELAAFSAAAPKSPVRELLEAEPDTAKFGKPERLADGRRVRVCVEVFGRGTFKGVGRNYRIAKGTAARCALRHLRTARR